MILKFKKKMSEFKTIEASALKICEKVIKESKEEATTAKKVVTSKEIGEAIASIF